jgi:hypothetical protein
VEEYAPLPYGVSGRDNGCCKKRADKLSEIQAVSEHLWIEPREASRLLRINLVALAIAVGDSRNSRTFLTMTSCSISWSCWLIQIEWVPASIAIHYRRQTGKPLLDPRMGSCETGAGLQHHLLG